MQIAKLQAVEDSIIEHRITISIDANSKMTTVIDDEVIIIEAIDKEEKEKKLKNLPAQTKGKGKEIANDENHTFNDTFTKNLKLLIHQKRIKDDDHVDNLEIVLNDDEDEEEDKDKEMKDFIVNDNEEEEEDDDDDEEEDDDDDEEDDDDEDDEEEEDDDEDDAKMEDYIGDDE
ncbi:hypothetical protein B7463_g7280, partial [Scytalidium lignicola]